LRLAWSQWLGKALLSAAEANDTAKCERLVSLGADVTARNKVRSM